jgi:hypothetical protein
MTANLKRGKMNKKTLSAIGIVVLVQLACGPSIEIFNQTQDSVRVMISNSNERISSSPEPGSSQKIDVFAGDYTASVIPAEIWINFAKSEQDEFMKLLDQPEKLTETQIQQIVDRINKIPENEQKLFKSVGKQSTCSNSLNDKKDGRIEITGTAKSTLYINCFQVDVPTTQP